MEDNRPTVETNLICVDHVAQQRERILAARVTGAPTQHPRQIITFWDYTILEIINLSNIWKNKKLVSDIYEKQEMIKYLSIEFGIINPGLEYQVSEVFAFEAHSTWHIMCVCLSNVCII